MKIAILTTKNQWFESYADALSEKLKIFQFLTIMSILTIYMTLSLF